MQGQTRSGAGPGRTGRLGEALAARHLEAEGWTILDRGWRDGPREIDLVARREGTLAFVEVKTRTGSSEASDSDAAGAAALGSVTPRKRRELERAAAAWLGARGHEHGPFRRVRFDVVAVLLAPGLRPRIVHVPGAWVRGDP
jgi:putative endonuclease